MALKTSQRCLSNDSFRLVSLRLASPPAGRSTLRLDPWGELRT